MEFQESIKVQENNYQLAISANYQTVKIILFIKLEQNQSLVKLVSEVNINEENSQLKAFGCPLQIIRFLRNKENYQFSVDRRIFEIKWKICGVQFERNITTILNLQEQPFLKLEMLQFENMLLKKTVENLHKETNKEAKKQIISNMIYEQLKKDHLNVETGQNKTKEEFDEKVKYEENLNIIAEDSMNIHDSLTIKENKKWDSILYYEQNIGQAVKKEMKTKLIKKSRKSNNSNSKRKKKKMQIFTEDQSDQITSQIKEQSISHDQVIKQDLENSSQAVKLKKKYAKRIREQELERGTNIIIGNKTRIDYNNGDYFLGQIQNEKYHGHGIYSSIEKGVYEGEWKNGLAEGKGTSIDTNGNKHIGMYRNDQKNGFGTEEFINQDRYEGEYFNDMRNGAGIYFFMSGEQYQGGWKNNQFNGIGTFTWIDGSQYVGNWKNDEKDGEGILTQSNGMRLKQLWKDGILKSQAYI